MMSRYQYSELLRITDTIDFEYIISVWIYFISKDDEIYSVWTIGICHLNVIVYIS